MTRPLKTIGFNDHNHAECVAGAVDAADTHCRASGLKLTPVRRQVLEILLRKHRALGAYEILDELRAAGFASQPPVAYRALEFLTAHGFAHRIERLNAFVACAHPGERHAPAFLICTSCDAVAETPANPRAGALARTAAAVGFDIERAVVEAEGICPNCKDRP
jgi:Fur family zinc uptake transcriptional regulator